jgi:hypothetical protein
MSATLTLPWRPWALPIEGEVVQVARDTTASFQVGEGFAGQAEIEVQAVDPWLGSLTIYRGLHEVAASPGTPRQRPVNPVDRAFEVALSTASTEAGSELSGLATKVARDREVRARALELLGAVLAHGAQRSAAPDDWASLGAALSQADFDPSPLLVAISGGPPGDPAFLISLRTQRWRCLGTRLPSVDDSCADRLWTNWRPLATWVDARNGAAGKRRLHDQLGPLAIHLQARNDYFSEIGYVAGKTIIESCFHPARDVVRHWRGKVRSIPNPPSATRTSPSPAPVTSNALWTTLASPSEVGGSWSTGSAISNGWRSG